MNGPASDGRPRDGTAPPPSDDDGRRYAERVADELATYRQVTNVHDLPAIYTYWRERHVDPLFREVGAASLEKFFLRPIRDACRRQQHATVCSLGSGNGDLELGLARALVAEGATNFTVERLELNDAMRERAAQEAEEAGLSAHFVDRPADLNRWEADRHFDVVLANHSLHHVVELEHLFAQVGAALGPDGVFVVNDMIGRNGHMRWPEALALVQQIWAVMPERYRYNQQLQRYEAEYENWDCSTEGFEGIRAQDILPMLNERFHAEVFVAFANVIDLFVDRGFGHNFDPGRQDDCAFIDAVAQLDEAALALGIVKPTHLAARFRTVPVECRYAGALSPSFAVRPVEVTTATGRLRHGGDAPPRSPSPPPPPTSPSAPPPGPAAATPSAAAPAVPWPARMAAILKAAATLVPPIARLRRQRDALATQVAELEAQLKRSRQSP